MGPIGDFEFVHRRNLLALNVNMKAIIKQTFLLIGVLVFADYVTADFDIDTGKNHFKGRQNSVFVCFVLYKYYFTNSLIYQYFISVSLFNFR